MTVKELNLSHLKLDYNANKKDIDNWSCINTIRHVNVSLNFAIDKLTTIVEKCDLSTTDYCIVTSMITDLKNKIKL